VTHSAKDRKNTKHQNINITTPNQKESKGVFMSRTYIRRSTRIYT